MSRLEIEDLVYAEGFPDQAVTCAWFAKCVRPANGLRAHPILGDVPLCQHCDDWCERMAS
jgi:hypothetical protein